MRKNKKIILAKWNNKKYKKGNQLHLFNSCLKKRCFSLNTQEQERSKVLVVQTLFVLNNSCDTTLDNFSNLNSLQSTTKSQVMCLRYVYNTNRNLYISPKTDLQLLLLDLHDRIRVVVLLQAHSFWDNCTV